MSLFLCHRLRHSLGEADVVARLGGSAISQQLIGANLQLVQHSLGGFGGNKVFKGIFVTRKGQGVDYSVTNRLVLGGGGGGGC